MFFTCNKCKYTFETADVPKRCPDYGMIAVRKATKEEIKEYRQYRLLFNREEAENSRAKKFQIDAEYITSVLCDIIYKLYDTIVHNSRMVIIPRI